MNRHQTGITGNEGSASIELNVSQQIGVENDHLMPPRYSFLCALSCPSRMKGVIYWHKTSFGGILESSGQPEQQFLIS